MTRLESVILEQIKKTNQAFKMWEEGESVVLGVSGGKDSLGLWFLLKHLNLKIFPIFVNTHKEQIVDFTDADFLKVINTDIYNQSHFPEQKRNPCYLCSRMRRRVILEYAESINVRKICFAHHKNDVVQTLLLNMIYSREISTMQAKQEIFEGSYQIIRPLYEVEESLLRKYSLEKGFKLLKNICPEDRTSKRSYIRNILKKLSEDHKRINIYDNIFHSLENIKENFVPFPIKRDIEISE